MGGIRVDEHMGAGVAGLFAAGEAVGGAGGANRLSGNAISEALVFGEVAGRQAARHALNRADGFDSAHAESLRALSSPPRGGDGASAIALLGELKALMWRDVGPFRTRAGLDRAIHRIRGMATDDLPRVPVPEATPFANEMADWHELRAALLVAESVAVAARAREESRGAHQREDFPASGAGFARNQTVRLDDGDAVASFDEDAGEPGTRP
jgi:succinate dehydrogenase/fumarate reductase flavoprotein subunit